MSRLRELVGRGVRLIVTDAGEVPADAAPAERDIPPEAFAAEPRAVEVSSVPASVEDFAAVYGEAGIELPPHGYGVNKVAEMLASRRLAPLGREVKAAAVMAALEAASVPLREVLQDAVLRDKALDSFEAAKEKELHELRASNQTRIESLKAEMEGLLRKINVEIEKLKRESDEAAQAFSRLQERKRQEESRMQDVVSHFIEGGDNPVSLGPAPAAPRPGQA
ncbi:MAG TPA: hypothetical protein VMT87_07310 [Vicinamibacteria bacterium]|nr:hypothetical protein [Vicinamibacteria bacterium]